MNLSEDGEGPSIHPEYPPFIVFTPFARLMYSTNEFVGPHADEGIGENYIKSRVRKRERKGAGRVVLGRA